MRLFFILAVCLLITVSAYAPARAKAVSSAQAANANAQQSSTPPAYTAVQPPIVTPRMRQYSRIRYALYFIGTGFTLLVLWAILATRASRELQNLAERLSRRRFLTLFWYYVLLSLALLLLDFPLSYYGEFQIEHLFGLSQQSFAAWFIDMLKGSGVDLIVSVLVIGLLFRLIRRSPKRWPLWFAGALAPLIAFGVFAAPLVIDPLFNKFTPMEPGVLRDRISTLAAKAGIPHAPIYVVDKSKQTLTTNAYVTGIGSSARIVIWDTTLKRMPDDQVVSIVGHEMGHYVLKHVYWGFAATCAGLFVLLPFVKRILEFVIARYGGRWGVQSLTDPAAIPVFLLMMTFGQFLLAPAINAVSRQIEHAADTYGLEVTGDRVAMARTFVSLSEQNLSDPDPPAFIKFWLFSHPPLRERIDFALHWKPSPHE